MYSISSQLFEGLTEYIVKTESKTQKEEESQKGPIGSGRVLADIIEKNTNETEKKFLHDYSYNLFEQALIDDGRVLEISKENYEQNIKTLDNFSFVKIIGNVIFNDIKEVEKSMSQFNQTGEALGYLTYKEEYKELISEIENNIADIKDRNKKSHFNNLLKNKASFKKYLQEKSLHLDEDFLKNISYLLNYGYHQQFEVQVPIVTENGDLNVFSAQLERNNLNENENIMIKKYSRETEREFTLFGILTQKLTRDKKREIFDQFRNQNDNLSMKEAITNIVVQLGNVEHSFSGKSDNEFIVDPIALYLEI